MKKKHLIERSGNLNGKHILCTAPTHFLPEIRRQLEERYRVTYAFRADRRELQEILPDVSGWMVDPGANYRIDRELLSLGQELKIVVTPSTGSDHVDLSYCRENGIAFDALRGKEGIIENIHASAEFSFALLLAMVRKLPAAVEAAGQGYWREREDEFRGIEISGKKIGLIGLGRIGRKMARYSQAFGAEVIVFDPFVKVTDPNINQVTQLDTLLRQSDIVCLHVHLDETTRGLMGKEQFQAMKKGAYFLNTSRGGLADEDAMLEALESGNLQAAAVDVISNEQSDDLSQHKVVRYARERDNLLLTPHIAGLTVDSQKKAAQFAVDTLNDFFKNL